MILARSNPDCSRLSLCFSQWKVDKSTALAVADSLQGSVDKEKGLLVGVTNKCVRGSHDHEEQPRDFGHPVLSEHQRNIHCCSELLVTLRSHSGEVLCSHQRILRHSDSLCDHLS